MLGIIIISLVFLAVYKYILHPLFLSALADIPSAHPLSSVTSLWIQWMRFSGQEVHAVNEAFRRKGAVVKLGPSDIAVNTIDGGVKTVYDGGFDKPDWYSFWSNNGSV